MLTAKIIGNYEYALANHIIISNHINSIDPFLIVAHFTKKEFDSVIPLRTMTANKYLYGKWYSPLLRLIGCFPASEHKPGQLHGLSAALEYAKDSSLLIFPEGRRTTVIKEGRLHSGAAVIANQTDLPVLPIFIAQKQEGKKKKFYLVRGEPFSAHGMDINQMMEKVFELEKFVT